MPDFLGNFIYSIGAGSDLFYHIIDQCDIGKLLGQQVSGFVVQIAVCIKKLCFDVVVRAAPRIDHGKILCNASGDAINNCLIFCRIIWNKLSCLQIIKRLQTDLRVPSSK